MKALPIDIICKIKMRAIPAILVYTPTPLGLCLAWAMAYERWGQSSPPPEGYTLIAGEEREFFSGWSELD